MLILAFGSLVGLATILIAVITRRRSREQYQWPTARGTVVVSGVSLSGGGYFPNVEYRYVHHGRSFYGIDLNTESVGRTRRSSAERIALKYPVGASVTVFMDPEDPQKSVLEPGGDPRYGLS